MVLLERERTTPASTARPAKADTSGDGWPGDLSQLAILSRHEENGFILIEAVSRRTAALCPRCGASTSSIHERRLQQKQDLAAGGKRVVLLLTRRRFRCQDCGKVFTEPDDVCGWRRRTTQRFRRHLKEQAGRQPMKRIARREGVSRDTVRRAAKE
jgi:transposase